MVLRNWLVCVNCKRIIHLLEGETVKLADGKTVRLCPRCAERFNAGKQLLEE